MKISFFNVGGAFCLIKIDENITIGIDPFLNPAGTCYNFKLFTSTRIKEPIYNDLLFENINLWLVTHSHADHIDKQGISKIDKNSMIIIQKSAASFFKSGQYKNLFVLDWNEMKEYIIGSYRIIIQAVPAFHGNNLFMRTLVGRVNGYLIKIEQGNNTKTIYITSDTVYHKKIIDAVKNNKIDILIANLGAVKTEMIGGPLTMSAQMLKLFIDDLNPITTIPVHFDDFSHYQTSIDEIKHCGFKFYKQGTWIEL